MANEIPTMLTIDETAHRTGLARHYVRQCCIGGKIVHVRCGKKYLVNFEKFLDFLNSETGSDERETQTTGKIRRLY